MLIVVRVIAIVINDGCDVDDDDDDDCGVGDDVIVEVNGDFLAISRSNTKEGKVACLALQQTSFLFTLQDF